MPSFAVFFLYEKVYLEEGKKLYLSGKRSEDYGFCMQRETGQEVLALEEANVPYFSLENLVEVSGYSLFVRGGINQNILFKKQLSINNKMLIEGGIYIDWVSKIDKKFLVRNIEKTTLDRFQKTEVYQNNKKVHLKVSNKQGISGHWILDTKKTKDMEMLYQAMEYEEREFLISDFIEIFSDDFGKKEYRCFVVGGEIINISRFLDYETGYAIPKEVAEFAKEVARESVQMPNAFVLDVAETDRGVVVVEANGIEASGRYAKNDFMELVSVIGSLKC